MGKKKQRDNAGEGNNQQRNIVPSDNQADNQGITTYGVDQIVKAYQSIGGEVKYTGSNGDVPHGIYLPPNAVFALQLRIETLLGNMPTTEQIFDSVEQEVKFTAAQIQSAIELLKRYSQITFLASSLLTLDDNLRRPINILKVSHNKRNPQTELPLETYAILLLKAVNYYNTRGFRSALDILGAYLDFLSLIVFNSSSLFENSPLDNNVKFSLDPIF
ncbi:MAG: hypothetical protein QW757_03515, partial [Candidatus Woesearchaeota archaeon]